MAISESALAQRVNINFSQIFLQHLVSYTFLHQSLGHHNFILELSGIISMILKFISEKNSFLKNCAPFRPREERDTLITITLPRATLLVRICRTVDRFRGIRVRFSLH